MPPQALSAEQIDVIFTKIEPWLKIGLSVNKSCLRAGVPKSTVYDLIRENELFAEKVTNARNHVTYMTSDILVFALNYVAEKVKNNQALKGGELSFVQWFALNSNLTVEEYGERKSVSLESPEDRIRRTKQLIEEAASKISN